MVPSPATPPGLATSERVAEVHADEIRAGEHRVGEVGAGEVRTREVGGTS
jgi:hypothetical protein